MTFQDVDFKLACSFHGAKPTEEAQGNDLEDAACQTVGNEMVDESRRREETARDNDEHEKVSEVRRLKSLAFRALKKRRRNLSRFSWRKPLGTTRPSYQKSREATRRKPQPAKFTEACPVGPSLSNRNTTRDAVKDLACGKLCV